MKALVLTRPQGGYNLQLSFSTTDKIKLSKIYATIEDVTKDALLYGELDEPDYFQIELDKIKADRRAINDQLAALVGRGNVGHDAIAQYKVMITALQTLSTRYFQVQKLKEKHEYNLRQMGVLVEEGRPDAYQDFLNYIIMGHELYQRAQ